LTGLSQEEQSDLQGVLAIYLVFESRQSLEPYQQALKYLEDMALSTEHRGLHNLLGVFADSSRTYILPSS
jgi:hypothetical protein